nr:retrovirus-related Pol polyprotein from transposon TNT 1-94 [Tanacetum cinerariifolium]
MHNNSQGKKHEVEDQRRSVKLSKNKTSITACNDSLNAKTLNVKSVSAMCDKCVLIDKHDMYVLNSVAKLIKRTFASESNKKPRNFTRKLYEHVSKTCSWWYPKFTPSGYKWKLKSKKENVNPNLIEIVLFIVDSGCLKHMTGNLKLLINFMEKFLRTVKFGNDQIAPILRYGDLVQGAVTIKRVYYVEGQNHNLFSVGQFCDADLEVAFKKSTCFIRDLKGNDLLTCSRGTDLYSITLQDTNCPIPICLMDKATSSQAWLWHRRLSHLNFDTINLLSKNDIVVGLLKLKFVKDHLCSSYELGKAKRKSFHTKLTSSLKRQLQLLHMDLCAPMRVASINGKRYVLVIVNDYSRYTWTYFLRSKEETLEVLIDFLRLVQRGHQDQVRVTLHVYFAAEGIHHQTFIAQTPEQNGVVERRNQTYAENDQVTDDEFNNIFSTPVQDQGEMSLQQVIGNPSQSIRTRHQLESDAEMCMFALTVSRTEPKNIKEATADSAWIESMQEELYQFDRLNVWELVDRPLCSNVINLKWLWKNKRDEENTV